MKQRSARVVFALLMAGIVAGLACQKGNPVARRDRMVRDFIAILPDSIDSEHRLEIDQLFNMFYQRADKGLVAAADVERIEAELAGHVHRGRIIPSDLVHFMADVGYTTYKGDSHYNLPDSSVDHPILNPSSAMYSMRFNTDDYDSAFWADFEKWKAEHPNMTDSMLLEELARPQPAQK
jgi:hypothetical protein